MSTLVPVVFNDQSTAFEMRAALAKMQKQYLLEIPNAAQERGKRSARSAGT